MMFRMRRFGEWMILSSTAQAVQNQRAMQKRIASNFSITKESAKKIDLSKASVILGQTSYPYDGKRKTPPVAVELDGKTLDLNIDYIVAYSNNTDVGTATVTITGKGAYEGSKEASFTIT